MSTPPPLPAKARPWSKPEGPVKALQSPRESGYDSDEEYRASAMIAAPPPRQTEESLIKLQQPKVGGMKFIELKDKNAQELSKRKTGIFKHLAKNHLRRKRKKKNKKQLTAQRELEAKQKRKERKENHPYKQQYAEKEKISVRLVNFENVDETALKQVLKDFYAFHDPITSEEEIEEILEWTMKNGVAKLNQMLKKKYKAELIVTEAVIDQKRTTIVQNDRQVLQSANIIRNLQTPGLQNRSLKGDENEEETVSTKMKSQLEEAINDLELSSTVEETKENLLEVYRISEPERLAAWENDSDNDFIASILNWSFRFGVLALCENLRKKYKLIESDVNELVFSNNEPSNKSERSSGKQKSRSSRKTQADPEAPEWSDPEYISRALERFYVVYNPNRLDRSLKTLVTFIMKNGVLEFNQVLQERYNEDLFTFENTEHLKWRGELMHKLFDFFEKHDPPKISQGLNQIINWTLRQDKKLEALNDYLRQRYNVDLSTVE